MEEEKFRLYLKKGAQIDIFQMMKGKKTKVRRAAKTKETIIENDLIREASAQSKMDRRMQRTRPERTEREGQGQIGLIDYLERGAMNLRQSLGLFLAFELSVLIAAERFEIGE